MRILFFADRSFPTDHSFLEGLVEKRVAPKGFEITWIMYGGTEQKRIQVTKWQYSKVILVPRSTSRDPASLLLSSITNYWRVKSLIKRLSQPGFDLIIVRNDVGFLRIAQYFAKRWKRKVLFQLSHLKEEQFLAGSAEASYWRNALNWAKGAGGLCLRELFAPKADAILCISDAMRGYLAEKARYSRTRLYVLPLGVDLVCAVGGAADNVAFGRGQDDEKYFYFVYCGTMAHIRRLDVAIQAFKIAGESIPHIRLILIGGGREPDQLDSLKRLAEELGISDRVSFKGQLSRALTRKILRQCQVGLCVIPPVGVLKYISPTKLMEYMEASLPVIATKGIPEQEEILIRSKGGVLSEFDIDNVARAMKELATNPHGARLMGRNGRIYIERCRNYDQMADQFVEILRENSP